MAKMLQKSWTAVRRFFVYRGGATLVEYAILIALTIVGLRLAVAAIAGG